LSLSEKNITKGVGMYSKITLLILCVLLIGCIFVDTDSETSIMGRVICDDQAISNVIIRVDSSTNWMDINNQQGEFTILNIDIGVHDMVIKKYFENGSIASSKLEINIQKGINNLEDVYLIKPNALNNILSENFNTDTISLIWNVESSSGFIKYELFRSKVEEYNRSKYEMLYSSMDSLDTIFFDHDYEQNINYDYYLNTYYNNGKFAQSNILEINSPFNIVCNGDFEEKFTGTIIPYWSENKHFILDSLANGWGNYCLKGYSDNGENGDWIRQELMSDRLISGQRYRISANMKTLNGGELTLGVYSSSPYGEITWMWVKDCPEWTLRQKTFVLPSVESIVVEIEYYYESGQGTVGTAWIDDIKIVPVY
jgi:hypothetical protein